MGELQTLHNIGKELEKQLNEVGIYTFDDLVNCGSQGAWLKIKEMDRSACIKVSPLSRHVFKKLSVS